MAGSDHLDMDVYRNITWSPADLVSPCGINKGQLIDVSKKFSNSLEKQMLTTTDCVQKATNLDAQPWKETALDAKTELNQQSSKLPLEMQGKISEEGLFKDIEDLDNHENMAGKDITDDICVDLRRRRLVHVSEGKLEDQAASQSKTFLKDHANFRTSSCQANITRAYDGINFLDVTNDTEQAKGPESADLLMHTENTVSSKQSAEKYIASKENEAFQSSKVMSEKKDCLEEQDIAINPMTENTGNLHSVVQGYPGNLSFKTALNQPQQTALNSAFHKAGNIMPLSRGTVTLPPHTAEDVLAKIVGNSVPKMTQNLPPKTFESILSQVVGTPLLKAIQTVTPMTAEEMLSKTLHGQISIAVNSPLKTVESLQSGLLPPTAQNLYLQTTQNIQPQTTQSLQPQTAQNCLPQTTQNLQPQTTQSLQPQTAQNFLPRTTQSLQPQTAQNFLPQTTQNIQPQTTQSLQPQIAQNFLPQTTQSLQPQTAQNFLPQTTQNFLPQTTQNLQPQTIHNIQPQTTQNLLFQTTQNLQSQTTQNLQSQTTQNIRPPTAQNLLQIAQNLQSQATQNFLPQRTQNFLPQTAQNLQPQTTLNPMPQSTQNLQPQTQNPLPQTAKNRRSQIRVLSPIQMTQSVPNQATQNLPSPMAGLLPTQTLHNLQWEKDEYVHPQSTLNILSPANDVSQVAVPVQHEVYSGYTGSESPMSVCRNSSSSLSRSHSVSSIQSDTDKKYYTCSSKVKHAIRNKIWPKGQGQQELKIRFHPYTQSNENIAPVQYQTTLPNLPILNS